MLSLCGLSTPLDWTDRCIRQSWSSILPAVLVVFFCVYKLLSLSHTKITGVLRSPFPRFLTLAEAEAYDTGGLPVYEEGKGDLKAPFWLTLVLASIALLEAIAWGTVSIMKLRRSTDLDGWETWRLGLIAISWLYSTFKPMLDRKVTPHYDLFALYLAHLLGGVLVLGGILYNHDVFDEQLPGKYAMSMYVLNLGAITFLVLVTFSRPLAVPSSRLQKEGIGKVISPEDYTSLWGWTLFSWIQPMISRGTYETLNEDDVWNLSVTMQARPVFLKFNDIKKRTLFRQLWAANCFDVTIDFSLTLLSVLLNYASPYFLKRIIDGFDSPADQHSQSYVFAFLMLAAQLLKAEVDVQHLWFGRRAAVHIRSELMSLIYEKALKRKDYSGIVSKREEGPGGGKGKEKENTKNEDPEGGKERKGKDAGKGSTDKKAVPESNPGADVGKIVNLMSSDANLLSNMMEGMYVVYAAPLEISIAFTFLYQLLGWSAYTGLLVILIGWPLNSFLTHRGVQISKSLLAAKDKRVGILNELFGAIKFIKFFAWEERWVQRVLDARENELKWLVKTRINGIMFRVLWSISPILVSILAFSTYVAQGNELTIGTAFAAIILFGMIKLPLTVIPEFIMDILQVRVSYHRIETFLNENEVDEQVSTFKGSQPAPLNAMTTTEFGLKDASFRWNAVQTKEGDTLNPGPIGAKGKNTAGFNEDAVTQTEMSSSGSEVRTFELSDISVIFPEGKLSVITGPTASGKTALLLSLLGEMTILPGGEILMSKEPTQVDEYGLMHAISYAAQTPWLQHRSIKENILFGSLYDKTRYDEVVRCCALLPDLKALEDGDETEIGTRGVTLSGGQKARVSLARAVYAHTKYVLLDDPLSAVDSHTSRHLYEQLFLGPLMRHRTVILVTHHVELVLPGAYYLVRMLDGRIDLQGPVKELRASGIIEEILVESEAHVRDDKENRAIETDVIHDAVLPNDGPQTELVANSEPRKLIKDEGRVVGSVKWSIHLTYLKAYSYWTWITIAFLLVVIQLLNFMERYWIKTWGEAYGSPTSLFSVPLRLFVTGSEGQSYCTNSAAQMSVVQARPEITPSDWHDRLPSAQENPMFFVVIYALIGFSSTLIAATSVGIQYLGALRASRRLFNKLLITVVRATMRWYDITPVGRMLNRFTKDVHAIDTSIARSFQNVSSSMASFLSSMIIVIAVFPPFAIPACVIAFIYYRWAIGFLGASRDLRRMEAITHSPIYSEFGELLEGIVTVRAFSAEPRFLHKYFQMIDTTTRHFYFSWMASRWLLLRFDSLGAFVIFTTIMFTLSVDSSDREGWAGWAALCITSAMAAKSNIYWVCRFWTELELNLNCVERVVEYLDLPQEPLPVVENSRPPAHWPSSTSANSTTLISVRNLEVRYAPELPAILHGISFSLKARERIGLLGRTGSGKSTLVMSILRFVDPTQGQIFIDGIDIASIGVQDLRSRLTFIPQDAILFSGTIRDNLDPFGDYSDEECLDALLRVHLITEESRLLQLPSQETSRAPSIRHIKREESTNTVVALPAASSSIAPSELTLKVDEAKEKGYTRITLETEISAGGLNFSAGQRQLVAMARALLRQSAIIILDEATSSIDFATDTLIQKTIREEFNNSMLLTVAHRMQTVIDYDRLIVLDAGRIAEFDTPYNLIRKEDGLFRAMCLKSGSFIELQEAAKAKAERPSA